MSDENHLYSHVADASTLAACDNWFENRIRTADGHTVYKGDRVFNYYDGYWGFIQDDPDSDGWFLVKSEDGKRQATLNGDRISIDKPRYK